MFLNHFHLAQLKAEEKLEGKAFYKKQADKKAYIGLAAPPLLDVVWCTLIRTEVYAKFCDQFFQGFLDRALPSAKPDEKYSYAVTQELLTKYSQLLTPLWSIWPNYSNDNLIQDVKNFVTLDPSDFSRIINSVQAKSKSGSTNAEDWKKIVDDVTNEYSAANTNKEEKVVAFTANKINFDNKEKTVKNVIGEIEMRDSKSSATRQRLQDKYMIDVQTAK